MTYFTRAGACAVAARTGDAGRRFLAHHHRRVRYWETVIAADRARIQPGRKNP